MIDKKYIIIFTTVALVCGFIYINKENQVKETVIIETQATETVNVKLDEAEAIEVTEPKNYKVYICGSVIEEKVVTLKAGSRIVDALEIVELKDDADLSQLNLASYVNDAQKIYVPKIGEKVDKIEFKSQNKEDDIYSNMVETTNNNLVDINKANKEELQSLPGIGYSIAEYIIEYRNKNGDFKDIEEIKNVDRIGNKTFDKIKDKIIINN